MDTNQKLRVQFKMALLKRAWERLEESRKRLPFLRRVFTRKRRDPYPGASAEELIGIWKENASAFLLGTGKGAHREDGEGRYISAWISYQGEGQKHPFWPILLIKYYDGCCFFMERKAVLPDGTVSDWGIPAPYDECAVNGVNRKDLPEWAIGPYEKYLNAIKQVKLIIL